MMRVFLDSVEESSLRRWRTVLWTQSRPGGGRFSIQVGQNLLDNRWVFNTGNDLDLTGTALAGLDVDVEHSLEPLHPGHRHNITGIDNSLGLVVALGLDYMLTPNVMLAADAYYLDVKAEAQIEVLINDQLYAAQLSGRTGRAPIIYALTLGYRF